MPNDNRELIEHGAGEEKGTAFAFATARSSSTTFSFHAWARQALGPVGLALGWTPVLRAATRKKARTGLDEFIAERDNQQGQRA